MNSFDANAQREQLEALKNKFLQKTVARPQNQDKALFKARMDKPQIIRIVPAPNNEIPIKELKFYYNLGIKKKINDKEYSISVLAPSSYGESDPIEMFAEMFGQENSDEYANMNSEIKNKVLYQLRPSSKYYIPIVVRGEESAGVKYWGVTEKLLQSLLDNMWKDDNLIYDPVKGRDLKVWIEDMGRYKQTRFEFGMEKPLSEDQGVSQSLINNHPILTDQFDKKSFSEIKEYINEVMGPYLSPPSQNEAQEVTGRDYTAVREAAPEVPQETVVAEDDPFDDLPF